MAVIRSGAMLSRAAVAVAATAAATPAAVGVRVRQRARDVRVNIGRHRQSLRATTFRHATTTIVRRRAAAIVGLPNRTRALAAVEVAALSGSESANAGRRHQRPKRARAQTTRARRSLARASQTALPPLDSTRLADDAHAANAPVALRPSCTRARANGSATALYTSKSPPLSPVVCARAASPAGVCPLDATSRRRRCCRRCRRRRRRRRRHGTERGVFGTATAEFANFSVELE